MRLCFYILAFLLIPSLVCQAEVSSWERIQDKLPFSYRPGAKLIEFKDRLVVYGGKAPGEVWTSLNGLQWTKSEIQLGKEGEAVALSTGSHLWIFDFWAETPRAWYSTDGRFFRSLTVEKLPRMNAFCALHRDNKIYLIGGWAGARANNDIWVSDDAIHWSIVPAKVYRFSPRLDPICHQWNNKIYVLAGRDLKMPFYDVWSSSDFNTWMLENPTLALDPKPKELDLLPQENGLVLLSETEIFQSLDGYEWLRTPHQERPLADASVSSELGDFIFSLLTVVAPGHQKIIRIPVPEVLTGQPPELIPE